MRRRELVNDIVGGWVGGGSARIDSPVLRSCGGSSLLGSNQTDTSLAVDTHSAHL